LQRSLPPLRNVVMPSLHPRGVWQGFVTHRHVKRHNARGRVGLFENAEPHMREIFLASALARDQHCGRVLEGLPTL